MVAGEKGFDMTCGIACRGAVVPQHSGMGVGPVLRRHPGQELREIAFQAFQGLVHRDSRGGVPADDIDDAVLNPTLLHSLADLIGDQDHLVVLCCQNCK